VRGDVEKLAKGKHDRLQDISSHQKIEKLDKAQVWPKNI